MSNSGKILYNWSGDNYDEKFKFYDEKQLGDTPYDITIVGAGVVGSALAYKLSKYKLKILLLDKNYDVGEGTSKGSSAIVHTGFDAPLDTLESKLVAKASREWPELAQKLKIPFEECGALVVAIDDEQEKQLEKVYDKGIKNGIEDIKMLTPEEVKELEPNITENALGGILIPRETIADPFTTSIAYAEVALSNGVDILLGAEISSIKNTDEKIKTLVTSCGKKIRSEIIVNVAGLGSEKLAKLYNGEEFDTNPRRGQFLIFDKYSRPAINHILLPIPTVKTKGVLVIPTIFGNLVAGPTAEDYPHDYKEVADTTTVQLELLLEGASKLYPRLTEQPVISTFSGVRSNCTQGSYWIRCNDNNPGILTVAGIRSTGFTSSPALAQHLIDLLHENLGVELEINPTATESRDESKLPGWWKKRNDDTEFVKENPEYGKTVCFCEQITRGEIIEQLDSPLKPRTLDSIKRRTRSQMGRCQGFDCMVSIAEIISEHCKIPLSKITKRGPGSEIVNELNSNYSDEVQNEIN